METIRSGERKKLSSVAASRDTRGGRMMMMFACSRSDFSQTAGMTCNTLPSHQVRKRDYCLTLPCPELNVSLRSCIQSMTPIPGIPNKLLLLKVDCYTHNDQ